MIIKEISILSRVEAECYSSIIPKSDVAWRLKTPSIYDNYTYCVNCDNEIWEYNVIGPIGIRPSLKIKFDNVPAESSQVELFGFTWTVISNYAKETLLLCDDVVEHRRYDAYRNDWNSSELKSWLEEWLTTQERKYNYV